MKKLIALLLACGMLCALAACSGGGKMNISIESETGSVSPSAAPQNTGSQEQTPPAAVTLELNTPYEVPDFAEVTLVRITTTNEVWASMGGTLYYENKNDGEIYIDAVFDVVNTGSETIECDELMTATAVGSNGVEYDTVLYCGEKNDMTSVSVNVDIPPLSSGRVHAAVSVPAAETAFTLNYDVNGTLFTCPYNTSTDLKTTTPLKAGDVIENEDYASLEFSGYEFTEAVYPTNTNSYYRYYKVDNSDNTYLALTFRVTNYQSTAKDVDTFLSGRATFLDKYKYNGFVVSENDDGSSLIYLWQHPAPGHRQGGLPHRGAQESGRGVFLGQHHVRQAGVYRLFRRLSPVRPPTHRGGRSLLPVRHGQGGAGPPQAHTQAGDHHGMDLCPTP